MGFDGVDDRVTLGDGHDFAGALPFTVEAWIRPDAGSEGFILAKFADAAGGARDGWFLKISGSNGLLLFRGAGTRWDYYEQGTQSVVSDAWNHVAASWSGNTYRLYVNGAPIGDAWTPSAPATVADTMAALEIGRAPTGESPFKGDIDEVAVYPAALSAERIKAHHDAGQPYRSAIRADNPAGYWRLGETNGTTVRSFGSGANGSLQGGVTLGVEGAPSFDANTAARFDGADDGLTFGDVHDFSGGAPFTLEAWVKPAIGSNGGFLLAKFADRTGGTRDGWFLKVGAAGELLLFRGAGNKWDYYEQGSGSVVVGSWNHVAATWSGTTYRLYVNGAQVGDAWSPPSPATVADTTTALHVGRAPSGESPFKGDIDETAVYPTALSAERIKTHYDVGKTPPCSTPLQTLIDDAPSGSTVRVPACLYREKVDVSKSIRLEGQPGTEIRGSEIWTSGWLKYDAHWSRGAPSLPDEVSDTGDPRWRRCNPNSDPRFDPRKVDNCLRRHQVFYDGRQLSQVMPMANLVSGEFKVIDGRIVLADDPVGHTVEVTVRDRWMDVRASDVTVSRFTMKHAAAPSQSAGLLVGGQGINNVTIQDSVLLQAHGQALRFQFGRNLKALRNDISWNGQLGMSGYQATDVLVQGNKIRHNNTEAFNKEWEAAGLKMAEVTRLTLADNEVERNDGSGLWCDGGCMTVTYSGNRVHHNRGIGIFFEISTGAKIFGNKVWENGWGEGGDGWVAGIGVHDSKDAEVYNNMVAWNLDGIIVAETARSDKPVGANTGNFVHDNTVAATDDPGTGNDALYNKCSMCWYAYYEDGRPGVMFALSSNNRGANNRYFYPTAETGMRNRFAWRGSDGTWENGIKTLVHRQADHEG